MSWVLIALLGPALHGVANVLDQYLSTKEFPNVWTLAFYATCFNVLFVPFVFLIEVPSIVPLSLLPAVLLIALIEVAYLYPYYRALQSEDTSIVSSLFSLGKIFVPLFAFVLVGEQLEPLQYVGFFIIIAASAAITLRFRAFTFNKSFLYMLACSAMLSLELVIYKYLFENVSWSTGFVWPSVLATLFVLTFLFIPRFRKDIRNHIRRLHKNVPIFMLEEFLTFGGSAASTYAIALAPVTLVTSIDSLQPFFVLVYALVFGRRFPAAFREETDMVSILKKCLFFAIMLFGVWLIL